MVDWSSLPSELVRRIADCLLDTNDLDSYMDFRAVCLQWRSATDDPKDSSELLFCPRHWIIIDEVFQSESRLLVNTVSGRVVRKDLTLLGNYHVVATTHGGLFVLADKDPPHAAVVLNPFTGHMISFNAAVPSNIDVSAAALSVFYTENVHLSSAVSERCGSRYRRLSPTLILFSDKSDEQYVAGPVSACFTVLVDEDGDPSSYFLMRLAASGGIRAAEGWQNAMAPIPAASANKIFRLMKLFDINSYKMFDENPMSGFPGTGDANYFFLVESAGELLGVIKLRQNLKVFRLDTEGDELKPVKNIGDRAIFVGDQRCISTGTGKLQSIVANCVYYVKSRDSSLDIYKYELENETEEMVSEAIDSLNPITLSFATPPFTIVQLLSSCTINVRESQLWLESFKNWDHAMEMLKQEDPGGYLCALGVPNLEESDLDLDESEFCD